MHAGCGTTHVASMCVTAGVCGRRVQPVESDPGLRNPRTEPSGEGGGGVAASSQRPPRCATQNHSPEDREGRGEGGEGGLGMGLLDVCSPSVARWGSPCRPSLKATTLLNMRRMHLQGEPQGTSSMWLKGVCAASLHAKPQLL